MPRMHPKLLEYKEKKKLSLHGKRNTKVKRTQVLEVSAIDFKETNELNKINLQHIRFPTHLEECITGKPLIPSNFPAMGLYVSTGMLAL